MWLVVAGMNGRLRRITGAVIRWSDSVQLTCLKSESVPGRCQVVDKVGLQILTAICLRNILFSSRYQHCCIPLVKYRCLHHAVRFFDHQAVIEMNNVAAVTDGLDEALPGPIQESAPKTSTSGRLRAVSQNDQDRGLLSLRRLPRSLP